MRFPLKALFAKFPVLVLFACSSVVISHNNAPLPRHHLPNGHFENTDDSCPPIRDTMEADSLVPKFRTRMYRLPIVRGNEELWHDSTTSSAAWFGFVYDRLEDPPKDLARARKELGIPDTAFYVPKHGEIVPLFR